MKKIRINKKYVWNPAAAAANIRSSFACYIAGIVLLAAGLYMSLLAVAALL